ncbi:hypothetical protein A7D00_5295 [Trichophyton violaceum]|uniref:Capsule polysaccharide biosynthesis protein n=1 Tax=Trichophyton violaceum TaxID=34388 RepID=A0A178FDC4_TRIVO|nr:hypothetical protein A7D00_5295 [Trichophyton violaceum]
MAVLSVPVVLATASLAIQKARAQLTWKNLLLLYILFNLKSVPFSWHIRLFYHLLSRIHLKKHIYPNPKSKDEKKPGHVHPIFVPSSITSRTTLWETDYNIHKSNSTYFSDLDIARTTLVTSLYSPGLELVKREMNKERDANGKQLYPGRIAVMLGSVYCTFKKEIKSFEKYEMRTKIAGWDEKWLYILTFFLRFPKRKGEPKVLLAVGVSKYVVKKGRKTVRPENVLRASGLLPPRPPGEEVPSPPTALDTPANGEAIESGESLDEPLLRKVLTLTENSDLDKAVLDNDVKKNRDNTEKSGAWDWHRIEEERLRGMDVVRSFVNIDAKLHEEVDLSV